MKNVACRDFIRNLFSRVLGNGSLRGDAIPRREPVDSVSEQPRYQALVDGAGRRAALVCRRSIRVLRAGGCWLIAAARRIAGADMTAVASAVCIVHIRERLLRRNVGSVDAVADQVVRGDIEARGSECHRRPRAQQYRPRHRSDGGHWGTRQDRLRSVPDGCGCAIGVGGTPVLSRKRSAIGPAGVPFGAIGAA